MPLILLLLTAVSMLIVSCALLFLAVLSDEESAPLVREMATASNLLEALDKSRVLARSWEERVGGIAREWATLLSTVRLLPHERPGTLLAANITAKHPVVLVPGIISTKLELWAGAECAREDFRQLYWGSSDMLQALLLKRSCWLQHIALNQTTGLDPDGIKLRPVPSMAGADQFVGGYFIWERVIHNLADIGYDVNNMHLASYDWRLSNVNLEARDAYFTRLKQTIELHVRQTGERSVVVGHSMGSICCLFFFQWVESPLGGNGGDQWVAEHIEAFVNIAGPLLGVPKTLSSLISGEMRDTAELNDMLEFLKETFISRKDLLRAFRSFSSLASMIPKGGDRIWGSPSNAPDDDPRFQVQFSHGALVDFVSHSPLDMEAFSSCEEADHQCDANQGLLFDNEESLASVVQRLAPCEVAEVLDTDSGVVEPLPDTIVPLEVRAELSLSAHSSEGALDVLRKMAPRYMEKVEQHDSWGIAFDLSDPKYAHPKYWNNPLESRLPLAPDMRIYSLYGTGKATERSYAYRVSESPLCGHLPFLVDTNATDPSGYVNRGIRLTNGDGTVPLISNGFMGVKGWKEERYNPAGIESITKEYQHAPEFLTAGGLFDRFRGGRSSGDHVDIMGNHEMITDLLWIVSGNGHKVEERIHSKIKEISERVDLEPPPAAQ